MFDLEDGYWWFLAKRALIRMLIERYVPPSPALVLDVGCGTGGINKALSAEFGGRWVATDQSALALSFCRRRGLPELFRSSAEAIPVRDGAVDLVLCLDVMYHRAVHDDRAVLAESHRVLAPGGYAIVTDSALNWLRGPHDEAVHTRQRYSLGELCSLAEACGFEIVKKSYANSLLLVPAVAYRLGRRLWPSESKHSDVVDVPAFVQRILLGIQAVERWLLRRVPLPLGTTVMLVARKA